MIQSNMPIHYISARTRKPFVPVNCGAIPENLFENELFGHVKGTFTDANFQQIGLVKEAEGGTLLLDEIGTVSSYIQIKLLRLLQEFWGQLSLIIHVTTASTRFANDFSGTPLHATIQTKLAISIPENRFEREADRVATMWCASGSQGCSVPALVVSVLPPSARPGTHYWPMN